MNHSRHEDYQKRKVEVMTEEQLKLGEKYLTYYKSSWRDKDQRGLFDKWEECDLYWEGEANPPESDTDPGSNTNIIHPNIEGQVALLVEQTIAIQPNPRGPSDLPFAETVGHILEWVKDQNKMKRKLDVHERRREKFGTGIFRVLFDPDKFNGFGLPTIEPCNPAYVFPDPTITDVYKIQDGRFIIETVNKSIHWAKQNFEEDVVNAIEPGYHPMESEWVFGEDDGESDEISRDSYLHLFVWTKEDGRLRLVEMSGDGVILKDSFEDEEDYFPKAKYPYFFTPMYYREGTVWAKGDAELLINTQNLIDDLDDQIRINARLTGNVQKVVGVNSGIDLEEWTNEPGLNIPANDPRDWTMVQPPSMPAYVLNRRDTALNYERQVITRFSDQMTGQQVKGVDTATEALQLQQAGASGIDHKKILLQETLSDVFEYCLDLIKEYYTEEQAFRISEKEGEFIWFRGSSLKEVEQLIPATDEYKEMMTRQFEGQGEVQPPEWMPLGELKKEADFDIEVTVGAGLPNNKAFIYQAIKEAHAEKAITTPEYRKLLRQYVHLPIEEQPEQPPQPQMQQGQPMPNENVMGLSQGGNPAALGMLGGGQIG